MQRCMHYKQALVSFTNFAWKKITQYLIASVALLKYKSDDIGNIYLIYLYEKLYKLQTNIY